MNTHKNYIKWKYNTFKSLRKVERKFVVEQQAKKEINLSIVLEPKDDQVIYLKDTTEDIDDICYRVRNQFIKHQ